MNESVFDPNERVEQMVDAIHLKTKQIVEQFENQTNEMYNIEYLKIFTASKEKVIQKILLDKSAFISKQRRELSQISNEHKLHKMSHKFSLLDNLKAETRNGLQVFRNQEQGNYKELLKMLIIQGMVKLMEPDVELKCLKADFAIVEELIDDCQKEFNSLILRECNKTIDSKLQLNKDHCLDETSIIGGVVLTCFDGKIICSNTIDSRMNFVFQDMLPDIRQHLFPNRYSLSENNEMKKEMLEIQ